VVIANAQLQLEVSQHHISRFGLIFWPNLYCARTQKSAISHLPIKLFTPPLDTATLISYMELNDVLAISQSLI